MKTYKETKVQGMKTYKEKKENRGRHQNIQRKKRKQSKTKKKIE